MKLKQFAAILLALTLLAGCGAASEKPSESTVPTETVEVVPAYGENDVTVRSDYAVTEAVADGELMRTVIAVNADGKACMDNAMLQIYYWIEFYNFMNSYGAYASAFGLDYNAPLAEQPSLMENRTWEQYFLEAATLHYAENYALAQAAYASGYELPDEDVAQIADIARTDGDFAEEYKNAGYESADAYLQANFGDGVCVSDYQDYLRTTYAAYDYANDRQAKIEAAVTDADIEAYYDENAEEYQSNRVLKLNNVSARHILIQPEGEKLPDTNDWTEEAWAVAEAKANTLYAQWQENPTEEAFALLANENSADAGSNTTGGIYEDFSTSDMVEEFSDWCFDTARVPGDSGIVKTPFGYHILYFIGQTETRAWFDTAKSDLISDRIANEIDELCETYALQFDYAQMRIFDMIAASAAEEPTEDPALTEEPIVGEETLPLEESVSEEPKG